MKRVSSREAMAEATIVDLYYTDLRAAARVDKAGARGITAIEQRDDLGIKRFFFRDPGGYELEFPRFLRPDDRHTFHARPLEPPSEPDL